MVNETSGLRVNNSQSKFPTGLIDSCFLRPTSKLTKSTEIIDLRTLSQTDWSNWIKSSSQVKYLKRIFNLIISLSPTLASRRPVMFATVPFHVAQLTNRRAKTQICAGDILHCTTWGPKTNLFYYQWFQLNRNVNLYK